MKILLIAPVHREKEYLSQRGDYPFLKGQGQQSWVDALENLGHKVYIFKYTNSLIIPNWIRINISSFFQKISPLFYGRLRRINDNLYFLSPENFLKNKKLLKLAFKIKPDLIIISGGAWCLFPSAIAKIKESLGIKIILFSGINPLVGSPKAERKMVEEGILDLVVENDEIYAKKWKELGAEKTVVLPISSVDPKLHKKIKLNSKEQSEYGADVCFVGTLTRERQEVLKRLTDFNLKIWGDVPKGNGLIDELNRFYKGNAYGEKMVKIFNASKIVLNFQPKDMMSTGNMRTFEIPGCGAFQLTDRINDEWFNVDREYIGFENTESLKRKIKYYLQHKNERESIARRGYKRAHKEHTYVKHFKHLFDESPI